MVDEAKRPIVPLKPPLGHDEIDARNLSGDVCIVHPTVMMRREAFLTVGGYDPRFTYAQDTELWLRIYEVGRLANLQEFLIKYRVHGRSISTSKKEAQEEFLGQASAEAAERRGIPNPFEKKPFRSDGSIKGERDFALQYGWQAWTWGFRATSRHFALRAIRLDPLSLAAWKLLVFGGLRRSPKTLDISF